MTHKSKQSSGGKKDYAKLYEGLLENNLPSRGEWPKWEKVLDNRDKFSNLDDYYKDAYLALKADLRAINKLKGNIEGIPNLNDLIAEQTKLALKIRKEAAESRKSAEAQSDIIKEFCKRTLGEMRLEKQRQEMEMYKQPKKEGFITVDLRLLSNNMTKSQLN